MTMTQLQWDRIHTLFQDRGFQGFVSKPQITIKGSVARVTGRIPSDMGEPQVQVWDFPAGLLTCSDRKFNATVALLHLQQIAMEKERDLSRSRKKLSRLEEATENASSYKKLIQGLANLRDLEEEIEEDMQQLHILLWGIMLPVGEG